MIRTLSRKKILFFPVSWGNSVARWIQGLCSPSGTIRISNDLDPGPERSASLDVDVPAVLRAARAELDQRYVTVSELKNVIARLCDGNSIILKDGVLSVNREWIEALQ